MKQLPIGKQNFEDIIRRDLLYVDKTKQVYQLIQQGDLYFLSRPRRFGKSLLVSTLKHLFSGKKELFKDLYIGKETDYAFESYPVLQFNFAAYGHRIDNLKQELSRELHNYATEFKVEIETTSLSTEFSTLIEKISKKGKPVVVLIDEYDKPIVDFLIEIDKAKINQEILRNFFTPLKRLEEQGHLRFLFITGVSKFSKVSLFSDLNNLTDLSMDDPLSNDLLGITHQELLTYFNEYIQQAAQKMQLSKEVILPAIKDWYDGYSFDGIIRLYNPFSLLNFFGKKRFGNYWFATGTPTFLVNTIRDKGIDPKEFEDREVHEIALATSSLENPDILNLLFQAGYLTIKAVEASIYDTTYSLGYPNLEIQKSMLLHSMKSNFYEN